ncbi:MAG: hypothetical protein ACQETL_19750 [Bacteroidota bacterium]
MKFKVVLLFFTSLFLVIFFAGCEKERGPISVSAEITPTPAKSGSTVTLKVEVVNQASEEGFFKQAESVSIQNIHYHSEFASGPRQYMGYSNNQYFSPSTGSVEPGSSLTVLKEQFTVQNEDWEEDVKYNCFVEVTSNGGEDRDQFSYTILDRTDSNQ